MATPITTARAGDGDRVNVHKTMVLQRTESANYNRASEEFTAFEKYKQKKFLPILEKTDHGVLSSSVSGKKREIWVGPVSEWGKKLPSGKNLADYIDTRGRGSRFYYSFLTIRSYSQIYGFLHKRKHLVE